MRALLLALALLAPPQSKAADLVAALGNASDPVARSRAYTALLREKPAAALPLLSEALPRFDLQGQEYGLTVLSIYPIEASRAVLQKLALDRAPLLEVGAAVLLWRQGEREQIEHVVRPFTRKDVPTEVRRALVRRVFLVNEPRLSAALRSWLAPETEPQLVEDALYHLLNVEDPEARAKALELAATPGLATGTRAACAAFLLALGEDAQGLALAEVVAADDGAALARLQRFLLRAPRLPPELVTAVARVAESARAPGYTQLALAVLALHAGPKELPVLERLMGSADLSVAKAALEALQKRGVRIPRETLLRMLDSKEGARVLAAADALRRVDDLAGFERVVELVRNGGDDKADAVRSLAKFRRRASVAPLVDALEDKDASVRAAAELGLIQLLPNLFPYRRFSFGMAGFPSQGTPEERAAAMRALRAWCAANLKP